MRLAPLPILYSFRRCPYAMRARMALAVASIPYVHREVTLRDKPVAMLQASPKGTVPVLVLAGGRVIDESVDIMYWALEQNDPDHWLPTDEQASPTMSLIASNDGPFKFHLDRMKYANRYPDAKPIEHRAEAIKLLLRLEVRLRFSAYFFRSTPTLADIAIFPFVRQFAHADANAFAALPFPLLQRWLAVWSASRLFQSVMTQYPVWQPDHEAIHLNQTSALPVWVAQ